MVTVESERQSEKLPTAHPSILIMGVGNILLSDEGVGVHVVRAMQKMKLPDNVELLDGGTASMSFLDNLSSREKVIIIDAVKGNDKPGTIYRFTPSDITAQKEMVTSLHQIGILDSLNMAQFLGTAPQNVIIYGIEPKELDWGMSLSSEVAAVIPRVIELIFKELGIPVPPDY
ncbi:MAG: HyaD/HybD family hydrogenase maturation endopeptidase [Chloroflexi bacterium]|nr:HyaD/HybD family hydrogenase maturation endopeptidase [Chloroflexota bacterium]